MLARRQFINKLPYEVIHNLLLIKHNLYGNGLTWLITLITYDVLATKIDNETNYFQNYSFSELFKTANKKIHISGKPCVTATVNTMYLYYGGLKNDYVKSAVQLQKEYESIKV